MVTASVIACCDGVSGGSLRGRTGANIQQRAGRVHFLHAGSCCCAHACSLLTLTTLGYAAQSSRYNPGDCKKVTDPEVFFDLVSNSTCASQEESLDVVTKLFFLCGRPAATTFVHAVVSLFQRHNCTCAACHISTTRNRLVAAGAGKTHGYAC